jgi:hypothetical protein
MTVVLPRRPGRRGAAARATHLPDIVRVWYAALAELRRAHRAARRLDALRACARHPASAGERVRQVARAVYGDRLPAAF